MSFHLLHVLQHGSVLSKDRGFLTCRSKEGQERTMPHEDIRAVIIAARGVTLTSHFMSAITESNGVILHCNDRYQPCGITTPLQRVTDKRTYLHQVQQPKVLNRQLWDKLLRGKTLNQKRVLQLRNIESPRLERALAQRQIDEANCARHYWQLYFPSIGYTGTLRERKLDNPPNQMLNYGYTVLAALCHRSLIVYGMTPLLGVQHKSRYRAHPLVYDLMEPFRPCVDIMLAEFLLQPTVDLRSWCKKVGNDLRDRRVQHPRYSLKLMDSIDMAAKSLAASYRERDAGLLWLPTL